MMPRAQRIPLLAKLTHFLVAFSLLLKALTKLEHPEGYWPVIVFLLLSSIYIVLTTLFHERLHHHAPRVDASVSAIECIATAIAAWLGFREGARGFPWLFVLASILFGIATIVRLVRGSRKTHAAHEPSPSPPHPGEKVAAGRMRRPSEGSIEAESAEPTVPEDLDPTPDPPDDPPAPLKSV